MKSHLFLSKTKLKWLCSWMKLNPKNSQSMHLQAWLILQPKFPKNVNRLFLLLIKIINRTFKITSKSLRLWMSTEWKKTKSLILFSKEYQLMILVKFREKNYKKQSLTMDSSHYKFEETLWWKDLKVISANSERIKAVLKYEHLNLMFKLNRMNDRLNGIS